MNGATAVDEAPLSQDGYPIILLISINRQAATPSMPSTSRLSCAFGGSLRGGRSPDEAIPAWQPKIASGQRPLAMTNLGWIYVNLYEAHCRTTGANLFATGLSYQAAVDAD